MARRGEKVYRVLDFNLNRLYTLQELLARYEKVGKQTRFIYNASVTLKEAPLLRGLCGPFPAPMRDGEIQYHSPEWNKMLGEFKGEPAK